MCELYQYGSRCDLTCIYKGLPRMIRGVTLLIRVSLLRSSGGGPFSFQDLSRCGGGVCISLRGMYVFSDHPTNLVTTHGIAHTLVHVTTHSRVIAHLSPQVHTQLVTNG